MSDYSKLPASPQDASAVTVLIHLLDSLGFRFHWATDGLSDADLPFAPVAGAMTLGRQLAHIRRLLLWTNLALQSKSERVLEVEESFDSMRNGTFEALDAIKSTINGLGPTGLAGVKSFDLPFWNLLNGPITDCIAHTGQINAYRRMLNKPAREINYFIGRIA